MVIAKVSWQLHREAPLQACVIDFAKTQRAPNMASSLKPKATFNTLPREIRDRIYENMLTESKTIRTTQRGADYGQPEDMGTLRATLHACRASPQFAREAYETFFRINTFQMCEEYVGFLNMPVYYVKGQGFKPVRSFLI